MTDSAELRTTPLAPIHAELGARMTAFAGTEMPLRYGSELAEHRAVRERAGLFDLSHMAEIEVTGPRAAAALDFALASEPSRQTPGRARYSLLLAEDGGILDDLIVYRLAEERFLVVANAGNRETAVRALRERAEDFDAPVVDRSDEFALLAVQGPASQAVLEETEGLSLPEGLPAGLGYYRIAVGSFQGEELLLARTGYTGEDGFELYLPAGLGVPLWRALSAAGEAHGLLPCGLACRDTLRLEAGMPLYGHELSASIKPAQAGLGRVVAAAKAGDFVGRAALAADDGSDARVLVGLVGAERRAGREGYPVRRGEREIGVVTSGALSPTLGVPIAMAYVDRESAEPGTRLEIDARGKALPVAVAELPFYTRG